MDDHRRKTYHGRQHRKNRGKDRRKVRRTDVPAVFAVVLLSAAAVILACVFIPGIRGKTPMPAEPQGSTRFSATEAEEETEVQAIAVYRQTEPETEAEPVYKYEENENTGWLDSGGEITLTFAGDILFDSRYAVMASLLERSGGTPEIENAFDQGLLEQMRASDVFMVNNEFPYSNRGEALPEKQFTFRADPAYATLLKDMGADIVSLANNHMYDYGEAALLDTLDTLTALGMPHIGAGRNLTEASAPYYFTNGRVKIGFITATQIERLGNPDTKGATDSAAGVFRCMNSENLLNVIGQMKKECDFIVCYLHWGTESTDVIDEWQKKLAAAVAEAGADLIIGDHPHVLQGIGMQDGVPVVYSLGNYLFNSSAQDTCLVTAYIDPETAELTKLLFIPARQEGCRTKYLVGDEKQRVLDYMRSISNAGIDEEGFVQLPAKQ